MSEVDPLLAAVEALTKGKRMSENSSNAEKEWEAFSETLELDFAEGWSTRRMLLHEGFIAGHASRTAEVEGWEMLHSIDRDHLAELYESIYQQGQKTKRAKIDALRELVAAGIPDMDADDWILRRADQMERELTKPQTKEETR